MHYPLQIQRISISLCLTHPLMEPLALLRLRSPYQAALATASPCGGSDRCTEPYSCPYHAAFGQPLPSDADLLRRHQKPPHPFSWQLPVPQALKVGAVFHCGLTLVGQAAGHLPVHLQAIDQLFRNPSLAGIAVKSIAIAGLAGASVLFPGALPIPLPELPLVTLDDLLRENGEPPDPLTLEFFTPLRLLTAGRPMTEFDPSLYLRQLVRRCSALVDCYGEELLDLDYRLLAEKSRRVTLLEQDLRRQMGGTPFAGLTGRVTVAGDMQDFWPWLVLGQWVNVGKGAAFGMGRFTLETHPGVE